MKYSATICTTERDMLIDEGWEIGAYWSEPGSSGHYYSHPEHARDDEDEDEPYVGPSGGQSTATDALLDRIDAHADQD